MGLVHFQNMQKINSSSLSFENYLKQINLLYPNLPDVYKKYTNLVIDFLDEQYRRDIGNNDPTLSELNQAQRDLFQARALEQLLMHGASAFGEQLAAEQLDLFTSTLETTGNRYAADLFPVFYYLFAALYGSFAAKREASPETFDAFKKFETTESASIAAMMTDLFGVEKTLEEMLKEVTAAYPDKPEDYIAAMTVVNMFEDQEYRRDMNNTDPVLSVINHEKRDQFHSRILEQLLYHGGNDFGQSLASQQMDLFTSTLDLTGDRYSTDLFPIFYWLFVRLYNTFAPKKELNPDVFDDFATFETPTLSSVKDMMNDLFDGKGKTLTEMLAEINLMYPSLPLEYEALITEIRDFSELEYRREMAINDPTLAAINENARWQYLLTVKDQIFNAAMNDIPAPNSENNHSGTLTGQLMYEHLSIIELMLNDMGALFDYDGLIIDDKVLNSDFYQVFYSLFYTIYEQFRNMKKYEPELFESIINIEKPSQYSIKYLMDQLFPTPPPQIGSAGIYDIGMPTRYGSGGNMS